MDQLAPTAPTRTPVVRPIAEQDWPQVHELVRGVAEQGRTYAMDVPADVAATREFWSAQTVVVAVDGDRVLGTAKAGPNRPGAGAHVGTASFVVGPEARGRGVGRLLGEHVVRWHRDEGFRAIQFNAVVSTNTAAVRLWRSLGFEVVGTVPGAFALPDGTYADLLVMHLDLTDAATQPAASPSVHRAAVTAFTRWGWGGTSFARVAELAGVPEVELTRRHVSLSDLLTTVIREEMSGSGGDMRSSLEDRAIEDLPHEERATAVARYVRDMIRSLAPLVRALWQAADEDPVAEALRRGAELRRVALSRRVVELLAADARTVSGEDAAVGAVQTLCLAENYLCLQGLGWSDEQYVAWLADALDHAVNGS